MTEEQKEQIETSPAFAGEDIDGSTPLDIDTEQSRSVEEQTIDTVTEKTESPEPIGRF